MDVQGLRLQIPATQKVVYLNTGWSGPSPRPVLDEITRVLEYENSEGPTTRHVQDLHHAIKDEARSAFASFVGAAPDEIVLTDNTTRGINIVLNGLPWQPGDRIVTDDLEHGSGLVPSMHLSKRLGVRLHIVKLRPSDPVPVLLEKLEEAITPHTRLLVLSHIMYSSGLRLPLGEVHRMAHRRGARVVIDAAQGPGQVALDLHAAQCDYYAMPAHKWVLGPDGVGALYVRRDLLEELTPAEVSGRAALSYDQQGAFEPNTGSVAKFELTTSSMPLLAGATAAIGFLRSIGMDQIEGRWQELARYARSRLSALDGVAITSPPEGPTASGLVTFTLAGWEPGAAVEELWKRNRVVARAVRYPPGIRLSIDFFNTQEELDLVADTAGELLKEGSPE